MNRSARLLALAAVILVLFSLAGCNKLRARDQLNKGVQAYKNAKYEDAIEKFKNAVALDPSLINARLYLATAYAQQYIPGADTPDNNRMAEQAIDEYKDVLKMKANDLNAIKGIAYLYLQMKKFDQAKEYYKKVITVDPNDPEAYYSVAVIDWTETYQPRMEQKAKLGLKPDEAIKDKKVCEELKDQEPGRGQGRHDHAGEGHLAASRLRRRHGLPQPDVARAGRHRVRRPQGPRRRPEEGRRMGEQDHGHQGCQGGKTGGPWRHYAGESKTSGTFLTASGWSALALERAFILPLDSL